MFIERITLISFKCRVLEFISIYGRKKKKHKLSSPFQKNREGRGNENRSQIVSDCHRGPLFDYLETEEA